jgi:hypothetical protein
VKREHHLSAQITHNKSNITCLLQGKQRAPFVSPDYTQPIQHHLLAARFSQKESTIYQPRSHTTNPTSLTCCKVKREHHLSAQITHNQSNITYFLQGEKRAPFVSPDHTQQIQHHLLAARFSHRREHHSLAQIIPNKSNITYKLQSEKRAHVRQPEMQQS